MWYEYAIIIGCLAFAAIFVLWIMFKSLSGKTAPCGSDSCACHSHDKTDHEHHACHEGHDHCCDK